MPKLVLPATPAGCAQAMDFLRESLADHAESLPFMELAAEELLVNVAAYAYDGPPPPDAGDRWGTMEVGVSQIRMDDAPAIRLVIRDWGRPFNPFEDAPKPDLDLEAEDRPVGGLGVHLARSVSAHQCYCDEDGANTLELFFKLSAGDAA